MATIFNQRQENIGHHLINETSQILFRIFDSMSLLKIDNLSFGARLQTSFWIVFSSFMLYLSTELIGWPDSLYRTMLITGCHLINFYGCYSLLVPYCYERKKYFAATIGLLVLLILLTPLRYMIESRFLLNVFPLHLGAKGRIVFIVFTEVTIAAFASLLRLAVSHERNKSRISSLEKTQLDSELRFLKAQMSPHFLFNSINNIYSLTLVKSDKASDALMKMSRLLRYLLYECHTRVTLHREIEALQAYTTLFQLKYEKPISVDFDISIERNDGLIEPLLLIPLIENAFKHSGLGIINDAYVHIRLQEENDLLSVLIDNSKATVPIIREEGGLGLPNIQKRLSIVYPDRHSFSIKETPIEFTVIMKIPIE